LSATYSGPYAANTPTKKYVYDSATVNSVVMADAKGRLAETYTCTGACTTKITDLGFSYSVRGELADVYQSSPNSGGYYHLTAAYWPHGALQSLSGLPGLPILTSGLDGEGRPISISASSGQHPMTGASYNVASQPTGLTYGSTDSDSFGYDPNTNRPISFNLPTMAGNLTWNANGSLGTLAITDQINPPNAQSCGYSHDDLARVTSVNCGPVWSQTFSYDAFGNISKSGTSSFQPTYSSATNRMTSLPGFTPTYDANGNLLNDSLHTYTWDAEGRPVTVDSVSLTYDALGRMAEQNRSGVYSQIVYAPTGSKLAIMSGQTLQKAFVPLLAGAQAVYTLAGLAYYRHPDWLGSSRLASTAAQSVFYEGAYAPFGEGYAEMGSTDRSFTGQNQDTATGLYDFMFREYSPIQGRWVSPDPAGLAAASVGNPQSWNRYGYVVNNPLSLADPLGLCPICRKSDAVSRTNSGYSYSALSVLSNSIQFAWVQSTATSNGHIIPLGPGTLTAYVNSSFFNYSLVLASNQTVFPNPTSGCAKKNSKGGPGSQYIPTSAVVSLGGNAIIGPGGPPVLNGGGTFTSSVGAVFGKVNTLFHSSGGGGNLGDSQVSMWLASPGQGLPNSRGFGAFAGLGVNVGATNANSAGDFEGTFGTVGAHVGVPGFGISLEVSVSPDGTYVIGGGAGPQGAGFGAGASASTTNTFTSACNF
ncbi:MAG: RHS repeat-associated core domain-containing protein, partial [Acidobacteriota bacterium]|nr:RHS repeat-associated core domain-containing protein [Acidobacteriota bacterium]